MRWLEVKDADYAFCWCSAQWRSINIRCRVSWREAAVGDLCSPAHNCRLPLFGFPLFIVKPAATFCPHKKKNPADVAENDTRTERGHMTAGQTKRTLKPRLRIKIVDNLIKRKFCYFTKPLCPSPRERQFIYFKMIFMYYSFIHSFIESLCSFVDLNLLILLKTSKLTDSYISV